MAGVRALIVDDSVVVRRMLTDLLQRDGSIEVVGAAATASIGLQKIDQLSPDVVLLDIEMPEMNGLEAVQKIRERWARLPVIMCSSLTERGAEITLRALTAGASDCVAKPSAASRPDALAAFSAELVAKIKALAPSGAAPRGRSAPPPPAMGAPGQARGVRPPVSAIGIGSSTGGPNALATVFDALPADLHVPIFIAQHMPPLFTKILADRLTASSRVKVFEGEDGALVQPGCAYVAPGNYHMTVRRDGTAFRIALNQEAPENSCRPAVDVLFRSLARVFGDGVLATVLTGMGHDGARGAQHIVEAGGTVFVQSAESCVVPSMPNAVAALGVADGAYPIERIGAELVSRTRRLSPAASAPLARRVEV